MLALPNLLLLGSIVVLQSWPKIDGGSGKNFINATVEKLGGAGVMNALRMNSLIALPATMIAILILIVSLAIFRLYDLARNLW
jgi:hypothetical protein